MRGDAERDRDRMSWDEWQRCKAVPVTYQGLAREAAPGKLTALRVGGTAYGDREGSAAATRRPDRAVPGFGAVPPVKFVRSDHSEGNPAQSL